uniref:Ubiquitin-conjugating enzyme E2 Z n=1 Tax=viral metagenome TaxID=1070528 RepID=A0A6C0JCE3_9ZZZZ
MSRATYKNNPTPIAVNRITFDIKNITDSYDVLDKEGIYFEFNNKDAINTDYKQLIIGPTETPYEGGFYFFNAQFPDQYPFHPPTMKSMTQGGGVRKHPNLYTCGKCCFSFLGTWSGPPWTACQNPKTIASSMKSVMTEFPLENEPGWEKIHDERQKTYARLIKFFNLKWGVCNIMENIPDEFLCFKDEIHKNFIKNYQSYDKVLSEYEKLDGVKEISPTYGFSITYDYTLVKKRLERLKKMYILPSLSDLKSKVPDTHPKKDVAVVNTLPKEDETVVNTSSSNVVNVPCKPIRKSPKESAKDYEVGTIKEGINNQKFVVSLFKRGDKYYKRWFPYKE